MEKLAHVMNLPVDTLILVCYLPAKKDLDIARMLGWYRIPLKSAPLQRRSDPIRAGAWKRITFLYTTGTLFNFADNVNDLVVRNEEREILWKTLRERSQKAAYGQPENTGNPQIDPALIELILGLNGSLPEANLDDY